MRFLAAIVDSLVAFVQRNPLFVLLVVVLALFAPSLLRGMAAFVLYLFMGLFLIVCILALLFRWRLLRVRRDMEKEFGRGFGSRDADPFARRRPGREGEYRRAVLHYVVARAGFDIPGLPHVEAAEALLFKALAYGFYSPEIHGRRVEKRAEVGNVVHRGIVVQISV